MIKYINFTVTGQPQDADCSNWSYKTSRFYLYGMCFDYRSENCLPWTIFFPVSSRHMSALHSQIDLPLHFQFVIYQSSWYSTLLVGDLSRSSGKCMYVICPRELTPLSPSNLREISRVLWKANFHYYIHKRPHLDSILSQTNPVQQDTFGQAVVPSIYLDFCRYMPIASSEATPQDKKKKKKKKNHPHHILETKTKWPSVVK